MMTELEKYYNKFNEEKNVLEAGMDKSNLQLL